MSRDVKRITIPSDPGNNPIELLPGVGPNRLGVESQLASSNFDKL